MFFIKLRWSSLGLIHMSAWTNFQLWSWVSNEKPKQTMEEWQSVAEFYTNYSNVSIYLFNQFGELKWQFSSFLDPPQWPHTWFPLRVSISYRLSNYLTFWKIICIHALFAPTFVSKYIHSFILNIIICLKICTSMTPIRKCWHF